MLTIRPKAERGHTDLGWLDSYHSFSFGGYQDPEQLGFRSLRVINDDRVAAGQGFGSHPHRDMEILTLVLDGELEHRDSMGTGSIIKAGDLQAMSAGTGVFHSEFNPSATKPVHFLQIWIKPERHGIEPSYQQRRVESASATGQVTPIASRDGREGSLRINQDAALYLVRVTSKKPAKYTLNPGRHAWVQVLKGAVSVNGTDVSEGDGVAISDELEINSTSSGEAEVLLFDLK
jgi:quercetin 2,3-dioxygenase